MFDVIRSEFIQILHNGKNHRLTISTIGLPASTVNVYDSLYQSLSQCTIDQICVVMFSTNDAVDVRFIDVEQKTNNSDCGVYAIAYATSLCFSEDMSCIQFCVIKMRSHLVSCLEKGPNVSFPEHRRNVSTCSVVAQETIQISCSCRMPRVGRMIQYCCCKEWYHKKCENVTRKELASSWKCRLCTKK